MDQAIRKQERVWGYCRVSTCLQDQDRQKTILYEYANKNDFRIERLVEVTVSSRKEEKKRGITDLVLAAKEGVLDVILFSELSRLARSVGQIVRLVDELHNCYGVELHFVKEGIVLRKGEKPDMTTKVMLHMFSLFSEIERDLISERVKDGLAARKAQGVKLGRPRGGSKLDQDSHKIFELTKLKVPKKYIAEQVGCSYPTLERWLKRHEEAYEEWRVRSA